MAPQHGMCFIGGHLLLELLPVFQREFVDSRSKVSLIELVGWTFSLHLSDAGELYSVCWCLCADRYY